MKSKFSGSAVAIVTPMNKRGEIDDGAFKSLLEWHIAEGSEGILVAGTTGESPTLETKEHLDLIARTVAFVNGRLPVIAGVGANATREAIELTEQACKDGADAGLSVTPYYNKPTQEGLFRHYAAISEAVELPLLLYDVPSRCVTTVADETVVRLAALPQVIGIKDAVGDVGRVGVLRRLLAEAGREDFLLISGDDKTAMEYLLAGGDGVLSVTANVAPAKMRAMVTAACAGDADTAARINAELAAFHEVQGIESNPIPVKAALAMDGRIGEGIRLPLTPLSESAYAPVKQAWESAVRKTA